LWVYSGLFFSSPLRRRSREVQPTNSRCNANAGTPVIIRTEGITELVGDLLLSCQGGTPTPKGLPIPPAKITLQLNTGLTSKLLPNGLSEALLLIDEPKPAEQKVCANPPCPAILIGDPANQYKGNVASSVYVARSVSVSAVEWDGVPIDAPGTTGVRIVRLTNVRANACQLGLSSTLIPTQIVGFVGITGGQFSTINNPHQTLANIQAGVAIGSTPGSFEYCRGFNADQLFSEKTPGVPGPATFNISGTELFPNAFKPPGTANQNVPGQIYNSESGFTIQPGNGIPPGIGTANFGTVFQGTIENVPQGINAMIPLQIPLVNSSGTSEGSASVAQTGTVSGNSMILTPNSSGSIPIFLQVTERTGTDPLSFTIPVTLTGTPAQVPVNLQGVISLANSQFPQTTLFAPNSPLLNPFPVFGPLDPGITTPPILPYQQVASIVPCTNSGNTLNTTVMPPTFEGITDLGGFKSPGGSDAHPDASAAASTTLIVPRISNIGLVSTALPATNIKVVKDPNATWLNVGLTSTTTPASLLLSVNPATAGLYTTTLQVSSPDVTGNSIPIPITYNVNRGRLVHAVGIYSSGELCQRRRRAGRTFASTT
jgi:hypothetical protein